MPVMIYEMWGDGIVALNAELATGLHSALETKLANHPSNELEIRLAEIATHCDVALNGMYDPESINKLCAILAGRLEVLRDKAPVEIILPFENPQPDSTVVQEAQAPTTQQ